MDKYEYKLKTEQMLKLMENGAYNRAAEIADSIDWKRVRNVNMLLNVSNIYEKIRDYRKSFGVLRAAYHRTEGSRKILYRLCTLAIKVGNLEEAIDYYDEYVQAAPKDPNQYILRYRLLRARRAPIEQQIRALEQFKKAEYVEEWAYELAKRYEEAGMTAECLEECDDLILWFSDGVFVQKAMELKIKYKPLTPQQQQKYRTPETEEKSQAGKPAAVETAQEEELEKKGEILEGQASQGQTAKEEPDQSQEIQPEPEKLVDVGQVISMLQDDDKRDALIRKLDMSRALTGVFLLGMAVGGNQTIEEVTHMLGKGEGDVYETGQMRIEEILRQWEERQRKNAAAIEEKKKEAEEKAAKERAKAEKVSKDTATILSEDIQRLLNEMESEEKGSQEEMGGTTESIARLSESMKEQPEETVSQEEPAEEEIMEETVGETEEAGEEEEEYEEEEYEEDEYDEDEYEEEEYDEDEYEDEYEDVSEDEFEEEYDEGEYDDEESDFEEDDFGYDDEEIEDEETEEEEPTKLETEEVLEIEEPDEDDSSGSSGGSSFDTGFIVQGRYDLSATSEIGLKLGLTEEQKKLFSYFVPIRGMSEQLVDVLEQDKVCKKRYGTSRTGNILVIGHKGSGKTVLAVDIVKAIQKQRRMKQGKVAIITGDALNKKNLISIIQKLSGGALIIEKASKMNDKTIDDLTGLMEEQTGEMLFILEDERRPMEKMLSEYPDFRRKFTSRVELPIFINDELVTFGQTYAKENGYRIDEMGILALYSRIDVLQKEDHFVTVAEVKDIMDDAIEHSQKANVKHLMKRVFGKSTDETDRIILKEDDFKH